MPRPAQFRTSGSRRRGAPRAGGGYRAPWSRPRCPALSRGSRSWPQAVRIVLGLTEFFLNE